MNRFFSKLHSQQFVLMESVLLAGEGGPSNKFNRGLELFLNPCGR